MSYSDEAVKAKLSALNETQDSIVTVAQWIMFHRRSAEKTVGIWLQRLKDLVAPKRLLLLYLANEVVQQSKIRRKDDFVIAFSPIIAEATALAYKGATQDVQQKLRRVIEVWRARRIFDAYVQDNIELRINELDRPRPQTTRPLLGGALFSQTPTTTGTPHELQPLVPLQLAHTRALTAFKPAVTSANSEYEKYTDATEPPPPPPVQLTRIAELVKSLASAEVAVSECVKARKALIESLESMVSQHREALEIEEAQLDEIRRQQQTIEAAKREVEADTNQDLAVHGSTTPIGSPDVGSTLVHDVETSTAPPGTDDESGHNAPAFNGYDQYDDDGDIARPPMAPLTPSPIEGDSGTAIGAFETEHEEPPTTSTDVAAQEAANLVALVKRLNDPRLKRRAEGTSNGNDEGNTAMKRRKSSHDEVQIEALELDEDVIGMLG